MKEGEGVYRRSAGVSNWSTPEGELLSEIFQKRSMLKGNFQPRSLEEAWVMGFS
jgi:hypothetical protein